MNPTSPSTFNLSEIWWRGIILALSVAVIVFTIWCLSQGITIIFMHLYYFPIVLLAYRYRWKGFGLATLLSLAYLGLSIAFDASQPDIILGALYRFLVFVGIAAVIAYLSDRLAKAQSTMQQSAEMRDRYLSLAPAIVLAIDRNGAITYLNKKGGEILHCLPDEVSGKNWADQFLPEKERDRVKSVFSELIAGQVEQNRVFENPVMTCGGAEKIIRWYNTVLYDKDGAISGILGFGQDITEEKWAQDTLREMQQFQESVITNANVWISVLEPDGTLLVWNDAAEAISGYKKTGVLGKRTVWKQLYPDREYRKKITGDIQRIIGQDTYLENFETEIRCADGAKKTIIWNTRGLRDAQGDITSYIAIGRDVTAQKSAEFRAGESSRFLAVMIDTLPIPIFFKDTAGKYLGCNIPFEEYLGIKRDQLIGKTAYDISPKDLADRYTGADRQIFKNPLPQRYETQVQYADGSRHDVIFYKAPFFNNDGSIGGLIGAYLDISERKAVEEEIRLSNVILKTQQETSPDGILIVDKSGKILSFNQKFTEIWGIPQEIIDSRDDERALSFVLDKLSDPQEFRARVQYLYEHREEKSREEILLKDGTVFERYSAPMLGEDNRYFGRVWYFHNITERKKAEKEQWESEIRFTELFETVSSGIAIYEVRNDGLSGKDYIIKNFNKTALALEGKKKEEVVGRSLYDLRPSIEDYGLIPIFRDVWKTGNPAYYPATVYVDEKYSNYYENRVFRLPGGEIVAIYNDVTEQKRAEAALIESKTLTDAVVENVPLMIFLKEARDLRFVIFNRAGEELLGYDRQALLGKNNLDLFPPEQAAQFMEKDREVLDGEAGMLDIPEEPITTAKKGLRLLHTRKVCIRGGDGTTKFLLGISEDITERKAAEEALRSREEQFRVIFHNQQTGLIMVDAVTHTIADANAAALSMIGASRDEVVGKICHTFICPAEKGKCPVSDLGQSVDNSERVLIRANGEKIPILKSVNPVTIGGQQFLLESFVDLSERKQMEKQISESRQLFADIISFLPDPTFVIDKVGNVLAWNRALEQLSGVPAGDMIGKGEHEYSLWQYGKRRQILIDLVLHPDQDVGRMDYTGIHWEGHTVTAQTEIVQPGSGHTISLLLVASPLIDVQGKITGAIESMRDISRLKEAEAELGRINQNLEQIVRDRTRLLQDEVAQRMRAEKDVQDALSYTRSVIEANPDLMVVLDRNGTVLDINATAELLSGIPREQLIGTLYFDYLVDDGTLYDAFSRLLKEGRIENLVRIRHTDGHITPLSINATLIGEKDAPDVRIIVAAHDITRQKKDEEAIQASLEEKVILLREVHHRVKNNLQIIISLVNLQMRQTDDPEVKQIMSETQNRVRAMSLVHEKLYRSESLSRIDFADYTRYLATQLLSFYGADTQRVRLDFAMGKIMVDINTAVPLGLLMNEIISNALKHAFPDGRKGTISISGSDENNVITLVVRDDGIGIAADFDWKNTTSLGMRLVTSLVDQVDGTVTLDRSAGTAFSIILKKKD